MPPREASFPGPAQRTLLRLVDDLHLGREPGAIEAPLLHVLQLHQLLLRQLVEALELPIELGHLRPPLALGALEAQHQELGARHRLALDDSRAGSAARAASSEARAVSSLSWRSRASIAATTSPAFTACPTRTLTSAMRPPAIGPSG